MPELITLCMMVTATIKEKHGRIAGYCKEAARMLVREAKKEGHTLVLGKGFFHGEQHWWTKDPTTGDIYDPTGGQFLMGHNGHIPITHLIHEFYEEVDKEMDTWLMGTRSSELYSQYCYLKRTMDMYATKGVDCMEFRTDSKGHTYLYVGYQVEFTPGKTEGVRSMVLYRSRKYTDSFNAYINYQHMVRTDGGFTFPVRQKRIYFRNTECGWFAINLKNQEFADEGYLLHGLGVEMSQLPIISKEN